MMKNIDKEAEEVILQNIVVGSRASKLALKQTNWVINELKKKEMPYTFTIKEIDTSGDQRTDVPLTKLGAGGVFLAELQEQLMDGTIDFAVHSLKDVPLAVPSGLAIASIPIREDHRDAYIAQDHIAFHDLPSGAVIGTSSLRRAAQLLAKRPDIQTKWIRGPIDTRLAQLHAGDYDAIILAVAGMKRLGLDLQHITTYLPDDHFVPAMGQGALAIECRHDDTRIHKLLQSIHHAATAKAVMTERLFLHAFDEGEQAPIGGFASVKDDVIHLRGMVISTDGQTVLRHETSGTDPVKVASDTAKALIKEGALDIIAATNAELAKE